jgi:hypothetical protein
MGGIGFPNPIFFTNFIVSHNRVLSEALTAVNLGYDKCQGRVSQRRLSIICYIFHLLSFLFLCGPDSQPMLPLEATSLCQSYWTTVTVYAITRYGWFHLQIYSRRWCLGQYTWWLICLFLYRPCSWPTLPLASISLFWSYCPMARARQDMYVWLLIMDNLICGYYGYREYCPGVNSCMSG